MTTTEATRNTKRNLKLMIRLTPDEKAGIAALARKHRLSISAYCRRRALVAPLPQPGVPPANAALAGKLGHTTSNLNQIAQHLNSGKVVAPGDLAFVLMDVAAVVNQLRAELVGLRSS